MCPGNHLSFGRHLIGRGFGRGRKLTSADLRLLILKLLAEKPRHGYEVIKSLEKRSSGYYISSPGMVYPAMTYLEKIGHATQASAGTRKLYAISAAGRAYLLEHEAAADALLAQLARIGEWFGRARQALSGADDSGEIGAEVAVRGAQELVRARRHLRLALDGQADTSPQERQRVAEILNRATAEILGREPRR